MAQCKARTANGGRCARDVTAPSRTLCTRHQNVLASGGDVVNVETRRKFRPAVPPGRSRRRSRR